jgi:hypothetical protein
MIVDQRLLTLYHHKYLNEHFNHRFVINLNNKINLIQIKTLPLPELEKMIYDQFFHLLLATVISTQVKLMIMSRS